MSTNKSMWEKIAEWWHLLWHHAQAGTLPDAPVAGGVPVTIPPVGGTITPPAPPIPEPSTVPVPDHGATPPANAGSTGVQVGQTPVGMTAPDADDCVQIPAIASKFAPGVRFMTIAALPFVPAGSAGAFAIAANCGNARLTLHIHGDAKAQVGGPEIYYCLPAVANPPSSAAVGGATYHLLGQVYGEPRAQNITNAYAITSDLTTVDEIIAYYDSKPDWKPIDYGNSPVAGPGGHGGATGHGHGHGAEAGK